MGKVVKIDSTPRRRKRGRKRPSKTALVLGGGGFTGGVYEIGALRALDLLATNSTVNNFDIYVGTSAGSFVAGMLANGVTPDEMMQVLNKRVPSEHRRRRVAGGDLPTACGRASTRGSTRRRSTTRIS